MNAAVTSSDKTLTSFRLNTKLVERLRKMAKDSNRSLDNYVETLLLDIVYHKSNKRDFQTTFPKRRAVICLPRKPPAPVIVIHLVQSLNQYLPNSSTHAATGSSNCSTGETPLELRTQSSSHSVKSNSAPFSLASNHFCQRGR